MSTVPSIYTLQCGDASISLSPARGGIITNIVLAGRNILFMNTDTIYDTTRNVRGGVPILFPQAGPLDPKVQTQYGYDLLAHGCARHMTWELDTISDDTISQRCVSDDSTYRRFPYRFVHSLSARIYDDRSIILSQSTHNIGETPLPVSYGLHPYFAVAQDRRREIVWDFVGGDEITRRADEWINSSFISVARPTDTSIRCRLP